MNFRYLVVFIISSVFMIAIIDAACNNNVATTELPKVVGSGPWNDAAAADPRTVGCPCCFKGY